MGMYPSKSSSKRSRRHLRKIRTERKLTQLQQDLAHITRLREEETKAYERELMAYSLNESVWKKERKRLKEEVRRLQMELEQREMLLGEKEDGMTMSFDEEKKMDGVGQYYGLDSIATEFLMEQMREERARRDEAIEKWKMLYLDIKNELDDLINSTHHQGGGTIGWTSQQLMTEMQKELNDKDDTIEILRSQIAAMEQQEYKTNRQLDILRQSLRIMTSKNKARLGSTYTCS